MTGPRSVLIVMPSLGSGGAERHAVTMASTLDKDQWTPHVLALSDGPLHAALIEAGVAVTITCTGRGLRTMPATIRAVQAAVDRLDPAVISTHDVVCELAARAVVARRRRPLLVWKHTYGNVGLRAARERITERVSQRLVTRYGAVCHTQVRFLTDDLGIDPARIRVVTNTVPERDAAPLPTGPPRVAMVAAMRADKGHSSAVRAWQQVVRQHPAAQLMLVGDGPLRSELEQLVTSLGLSGNVQFTGELRDPAPVVTDAHVVLVASYTVECFPYAVLEAMAAGRAVVSTDIGGMPEMVDDGVTGLLVPPRDDAGLAGALLAMFADPELAARFGTAARERLNRVLPFSSWQNQVACLLHETAHSAHATETGTPR